MRSCLIISDVDRSQANLGPEETKLYVEFLTAVRGSSVGEAEVRSMTAAAIKNVDQACPMLPRPVSSYWCGSCRGSGSGS